MKKFTQELANKMAEAIAGNSEFKAFTDDVDIKSLAKKNGTFKFVISDETKDRAGEVVKVDGWDLTNFKNNPVVLFGHDYGSIPVGKGTKTYVEGNKLIGEGIFAGHEQAQTLRKMYEDGFIKTVSVGFIPKEFDANDDSIITKSELLEYSFVPVPANPKALTLAKEKGYETTELMKLATKGLFDFSVKETTQEPDAEDTPIVTGDEPTEKELEDIDKKEKGAVLDNFNKDTKSKKFRPIDDAFMALISAYFWDDSAKVEDFEEMATEFGNMVLDIAKGKTPKAKMLDLDNAKGIGLDAYTVNKDTQEMLALLKSVFNEKSEEVKDDAEDPDVLKHNAIKGIQEVAKGLNTWLCVNKKTRK